MPLIFVTGVSGAGKSTVREELRRRGLPAYDTDKDEIAQWRNKATGVVTPLLAEAHRTMEFLRQNDWNADPERVRQLAEAGRERTVFLCGTIGNDDDVWSYFDKVFLLSIDEATMRRRLSTRTTHDFGTRPHELELLLVWRELGDDYYARRGAIVLDATKPSADLVDEIITFVRD